MTSLVALTGATGFIGSNIAQALLESGTKHRLLARRLPSQPQTNPNREWIHGDLGDTGALKRLVRGADAVVHCAGAVRGGSREAFLRVNARGTRSLAEAAAAEDPPPRFLLLSSLAAREPHLSWYAESKQKAETELRSASETMPGAVFRPTAVHGPGDREMLPLFRAMRRGILPVLGPRDARVTLLHVEDLVRAITLWLEREEPVTGTFELHDGREGGYDWPGIAAMASRAWGRPVRSLPIPKGLLIALATASLTFARAAGRDPMLTPGKVRELRHPDWRCDNGPLTEALGWKPLIDLSAALQRM